MVYTKIFCSKLVVSKCLLLKIFYFIKGWWNLYQYVRISRSLKTFSKSNVASTSTKFFNRENGRKKVTSCILKGTKCSYDRQNVVRLGKFSSITKCSDMWNKYMARRICLMANKIQSKFYLVWKQRRRSFFSLPLMWIVITIITVCLILDMYQEWY